MLVKKSRGKQCFACITQCFSSVWISWMLCFEKLILWSKYAYKCPKPKSKILWYHRWEDGRSLLQNASSSERFFYENTWWKILLLRCRLLCLSFFSWREKKKGVWLNSQPRIWKAILYADLIKLMAFYFVFPLHPFPSGHFEQEDGRKEAKFILLLRCLLKKRKNK